MTYIADSGTSRPDYFFSKPSISDEESCCASVISSGAAGCGITIGGRAVTDSSCFGAADISVMIPSVTVLTLGVPYKNDPTQPAPVLLSKNILVVWRLIVAVDHDDFSLVDPSPDSKLRLALLKCEFLDRIASQSLHLWHTIVSPYS